MCGGISTQQFFALRHYAMTIKLWPKRKEG